MRVRHTDARVRVTREMVTVQSCHTFTHFECYRPFSFAWRFVVSFTAHAFLCHLDGDQVGNGLLAARCVILATRLFTNV